jgi:hypothetical protein
MQLVAHQSPERAAKAPVQVKQQYKNMGDPIKRQSGAPATGKTSRDLARAAQKEAILDLINRRLQVAEAVDEVEEFGGEEDVAETVAALVARYPAGIAFPFVCRIVPDVTAKIRQKLVDEGRITAEKDGQSYLLKPVTE